MLLKLLNKCNINFEISKLVRSIHSLPDLQKQFSALKGGNVDCKLNDDSGFAIITLQHSQKKNAISGYMMSQLLEIVDKLEKWNSGKALLFKADGDYFCSGGYLGTVENLMNADGAEKMSFLMHCVTTRMSRLPLLTVALLNGPALGGGAELATAFDYRIFTPTGKIGFVQANMGVTTGWGGGTRLIQLVGPQLGFELMLSCEIINSDKAKIIGLADWVTKSDHPLEEVLSWLSETTKHPPEVIAAIKRTVIAAREHTTSQSLTEERQNFIPLWGGNLHQVALKKRSKHK